jgi:hypothetical protein
VRLLASEAKGSSGRVEVSRWDCRLSGELAKRVVPAGRFAIVLPVGPRDEDLVWVGRRVGARRVNAASLSSPCRQVRLSDKVQRQYGDGLTPTTRFAPPDPGHRSTARLGCHSPGTLPIGAAGQVVQARAQVSPDYGSDGYQVAALGVGCWAWRPARKMWMPNWNESSVEMRASSGQDEPARLP